MISYMIHVKFNSIWRFEPVPGCIFMKLLFLQKYNLVLEFLSFLNPATICHFYASKKNTPDETNTNIYKWGKYKEEGGSSVLPCLLITSNQWLGLKILFQQLLIFHQIQIHWRFSMFPKTRIKVLLFIIYCLCRL